MVAYPDEMISRITNAKQAALLKAAYILFRKHGFQRVSIEEICRTAGVSKVTFYKHYTGKDELIKSIVKSVFETQLRISDAIMQSKQSIKEKFEQIILSKQSLISELGEELMHSILTTPSTVGYLNELSVKVLSDFKAFLFDEQQKGNINPRLSMDFVLLFLGEINRMINDKTLLQRFGSVEQLVSQINEILMFGIVARVKQ
jgi:AcrR family transcriptional regulator